MRQGVLLRAVRLFDYFQTHQLEVFGTRCFSAQNVPMVGNAGQPKVEKISKAVKLYLERAVKHDEFMKEQIADYEIGKRHLANIMGLDPETITQEDVDKAVEYLLPSGLFDKRARPKVKHPLEIFPKFKAAEFGIDGRPFSSFFYTVKPILNEHLHNISRKVAELKKYEDEQLAKGVTFDQSLQMSLGGSEWMDKDAIEKKFNEKLTDHEFKTLALSLEHLSKFPYSFREKDFIYQFRVPLNRFNYLETYEKRELNSTEDGLGYMDAEGKRKEAVAAVKVFEKGTGKVTVNGDKLLVYFPRLTDREQILFPLHLTESLGKFDIEASVEKGGPSGQAGAIRLAISRALLQLVPESNHEKLRLAGLLTQDPRLLERKKPGQRGARAKFTWKKR